MVAFTTLDDIAEKGDVFIPRQRCSAVGAVRSRKGHGGTLSWQSENDNIQETADDCFGVDGDGCTVMFRICHIIVLSY